MTPSVADVVARVSDAAFGRRLVTNVLRGHLVEAMVALALEPEWRWCAADYASWDFDRADGLRVEVKQSAVLQSWTTGTGTRARPSFDVRERTGHWDGGLWIAEPGRAAHIYLFCHHERCDADADHRDPRQWSFFVVATGDLPMVKRLAIGSVRRLAAPTAFDGLAREVGRVARDLSADQPTAPPSRS